MECHQCIGSRVMELESPGMQKGSIQVFDRPRQLRGATAYSVPSIKRISDNRMALLREVNADLVSPSRFNPDTQKRHETVLLFYYIMGNSLSFPVGSR